MLELCILQAIAIASRADLKRPLTIGERSDRFVLEGALTRIIDEIDDAEARAIEDAELAATDDPGRDVDE